MRMAVFNLAGENEGIKIAVPVKGIQQIRISESLGVTEVCYMGQDTLFVVSIKESFDCALKQITGSNPARRSRLE